MVRIRLRRRYVPEGRSGYRRARAGVRRPRGEPRRPRGDDPAGGRARWASVAGRGRRRRLLAPRDGARGAPSTSPVPQRRARARDGPRAASAARRSSSTSSASSAASRRRALGPADDRPRPAALRGPVGRRAGSHAPAPASPRAPLRARAARRARAGRRRPGRGSASELLAALDEDDHRDRPRRSCPRDVARPAVSLRREECPSLPVTPGCRGYTLPMSHLDELDEFEAELELAAEAGVHGRLPALPLLRPHAGRDLPVQQARPQGRAAGELPVLPRADGGRLGVGQEPADADHPARRGLHVRRRDGRGAARRGRRAEAHGRGARGAARRGATAPTTRKRSRSALGDCRVRASRGMLLAVDVGNTQTVLGLYEGGQLAENWRIATDRTRTGDELGVLLGGLLDPDAVDGICLSTTVPTLCARMAAPRRALGARAAARRRARESRPGSRSATTTRARSARTGSSTPSPPGRATGRRRSSSTSARRRTSTSSRPQGEYVGGVLAPGIEISMEALFARAARLVNVDFAEPPTVIGKTTVGGLQSGLVYGSAGQVDGIVARIRGELGVASGPASSPRAGSRSSWRRTARRSSTSTRSSRSRGSGSSGS